MDANKLKELKEVGYSIRRCCYNCTHARFRRASTGFTTCMLHEYDHLKHTNIRRELSIYLGGYCKDHKWAQEHNLHAFEEFKDG